MSLSIGSSAGLQIDPSEMRDRMQAGLARLKKSDPALADKMEKIDARMQQLQKAGTDPKSAMQDIQKEFGAPTQAEQKEIQSAMGVSGPPPGGSGGAGDIGNLGNQSKNEMLSQLVQELNSGSDSSSSSSSSTTSDNSTSSSSSSTSTQSLYKQLQKLVSQYQASSSQSSNSSFFGSEGLAA